MVSLPSDSGRGDVGGGSPTAVEKVERIRSEGRDDAQHRPRFEQLNGRPAQPGAAGRRPSGPSMECVIQDPDASHDRHFPAGERLPASGRGELSRMRPRSELHVTIPTPGDATSPRGFDALAEPANRIAPAAFAPHTWAPDAAPDILH
jgi:hypothetical protein